MKLTNHMQKRKLAEKKCVSTVDGLAHTFDSTWALLTVARLIP